MIRHRPRGSPALCSHETHEEYLACRRTWQATRREARRQDPVWQQRRAEARERRRQSKPARTPKQQARDKQVTQEQVARWERERKQRLLRTQLGLTAKPCPPPDWEDEDAVAAYAAMELAHGHTRPNQPQE
jgi:hypothetical protein